MKKKKANREVSFFLYIFFGNPLSQERFFYAFRRVESLLGNSGGFLGSLGGRLEAYPLSMGNFHL